MKKLLKKWLGILDIENRLSVQSNVLETQSKKIRQLEAKVSEFETLVNIGVDVNMVKSPSWAIICLRGNPDTVKYFEFDRNEVKDIADFMRRYSRANQIMDAAPSVRWFIDDVKRGDARYR